MLLLLYYAEDHARAIVHTGQEIGNPGGRIVGGTFSRGQWHDVKRDIAAKKVKDRQDQEAVEAREEAARQREIDRIAAEIAARHAAEDAAHQQVLAGMTGQAPALDASMAQLQRIAQQAAHGAKMVKEQRLAREAAEEEEALAALMMH